MSNSTDHPWNHINPAGFPTPQLPNQGYRVWLALIVMIISSGFFVIARISTRIVTQQMGSDDYTILAALASFLIQTTLWALSVKTGYGADYLKLNTFYRQEFNKWWFLGSIFYLLTITLYKTSIILLLKRIFVQRGFQIACWCILIVNSCWGLGNVFGWLFQCLPIPSMWGVVEATRCFNLQGLWISIASWDVASDAFILVMPMPMVWKLNLKTREKIMVTGVFLLGAVVMVFSLMSCSAVVQSLESFGDKNEYTFGLANLFQVLESGMGIIGACLPIMRQPLANLFPSLLRSYSSRRSPRYYENRISEPYVLQDLSGRDKGGVHAAWNSISASGTDKFKTSAPRESDEYGIIADAAQELASEEHGKGKGNLYGVGDRWGHGIKKEIGYEIRRK